jgi:two-component system LytT family sensor kinase
VVKEVAPAALDVIVPSMILQPLVENSIKHGLARKVGGGRITIKAMVREGHTVIEVHDDGLGMTEDRLEHALGDGIGLSNVNERLRTIYGANYHLKLTSVPGKGTCARVEIPELAVLERVTA